MKIGIVLHPYGERKPSGLSRTIFELTKGLVGVDKENEYIIFVKNKPTEKIDLPGQNWKMQVLGGGSFWLERLRHTTADVYVFNTPVLPLFYRPARSIIIALDFAFLILKPPGWKNFIVRWLTFVYYYISLRRAEAVIAISEATKTDLIKFFNVSEKKIRVVYCGFKKICQVAEKAVEAPAKFFFFAGVVKERKNVFNIVKAFNKIQQNLADYFLLIAGKDESKYAGLIKDYARKEGIEKRIIWAGYCVDSEVSYLYKRAVALVFPSLVEGFGFPVLEAMDCGLPVITSNLSSLAEVGGEAAALVDPKNIDEIAQAMRRVAVDSDWREKLVEKGRLWAQNFSWEKSAKEVLAVIKENNKTKN